MANRKRVGRRKGTPKTGGRKAGTPNKSTTEVANMCRRIVTSAAYRKQLMARAASGKIAPAVECMLWHYTYGKPKETTVLENPDGSSMTFTLRLDNGE